jgi:hypothetical protein
MLGNASMRFFMGFYARLQGRVAIMSQVSSSISSRYSETGNVLPHDMQQKTTDVQRKVSRTSPSQSRHFTAYTASASCIEITFETPGSSIVIP